jgi:LysM repeat protein
MRALRAPLGLLLVVALASSVACTSCTPAPAAGHDAAPGTPASPRAAADPPPLASGAAPGAPEPKAAARPVTPGNPTRPGKYDVTVPSPPGALADFLRAHMPKGGSVSVSGDEPPKVHHKVAAGDTLFTIANAYLSISELYKAGELAGAIAKKNPGGITPGKTIEIAGLVTRVIHDDPQDERLGWPEDRALRGVFVTGPYAGIRWVDTLDKLAERGLNAVVLDQKDYEGYINYPSKVKLVAETGAARNLHIPDLARAVRFAHWRGIRVILRIPCFHDPWTDKHTTDSRMSIRYAPTGKPIHVNWLDPTNTEAQDYAIDLAKEGLEAGADEIQLDYVRFPVHLSSKVAVLPAKEERSKIIRDFVKRVHAVTSQAGAALSLDFFGVAATGEMSDIEYLGQHIPTVAPEADAISLMSYPSHYSKGWMGFKEPGEHPEIIGIGNVAALKQLTPTGAHTILRTWLQAFPLRSSNYGSAYVVAEAKSAETSGGVGWLMWSPACEYSAVWNGFPKTKK